MDGSVAILGIKKSRLVWILHDKVALLKAGCQKFVQEFRTFPSLTLTKNVFRLPQLVTGIGENVISHLRP